MIKIIAPLSFILLSFFSCDNKKNQSKEKVITNPSININKADSISNLIKSNSSNPELYVLRAEEYLKNNQLILADVDFKKALSLDSNNTKYLFGYGNLKMITNQSHEASKIWEKCSRLDKENISCRLKLSELYLYIQDYEKTIKISNEILKIDNNKDIAYFYKGVALAEAGDTIRGLNSLQEALRLNPDNFNISDVIASIYSSKNNTLAIDFYKSLQKKFPNNSKPFFDLAYFYHKRKDWKNAISYYEKANQINPEDGESYYNLAFSYSQLKEYPLAITNFTKSSELLKNNLKAIFARGFMYELSGNTKKAIEDYTLCTIINIKFNPAHEGLERLKK